ncbi:MAG: hypothetical protein AAGK02_02455 [Pseudomonadota bacterium]
MKDQLHWAAHIMRNSPVLALQAGKVAIASRTFSPPVRKQILVGTHHKALTVFISRVFRAFASVTGRSWDISNGKKLNYSRTVLIDHQSWFDFDRVEQDYFGLHIIRDPRDLLVSSAHYHTRSDEKWLHRPMEKFGGKTYAEAIAELPSLEERMLFELRNSTGRTIRGMLDWDYHRPGFVEMRYDQLIGKGAVERFRQAIEAWPVSQGEKELLAGLFRYFSLGEPGTRQSKHIRNPKSGQWEEHFTPRVRSAFDAAFPKAIARLGFDKPSDGAW